MNLDQLAAVLGLSKTTVSRALAGYPDVSAKTAERVRRAAEQHGYRPNPLAQRLRAGRAEAVGLVIPTDRGAFSDPFFLDLLTSLSRTLAERGLELLVSAADQGEAEMAALRRLVEGKRVDGVVVVRTRWRDARIGYLLDRQVPMVCHGRTQETRAYAFVDMDGKAGFLAATSRLIGLGHRRIGYVGLSPTLTYSVYQRQGYLAGLRAAGLPVDPALMLEGEAGEAAGEAAARALLALAQPPSALLCATDLEAIGALRAIERAGLVAGRDVAVIGHDDLPAARYTRPPLTTLRQPRAAVGVRLAEMLVALMGGAEPAGLQEIWQPELIARESDGPPPDIRATNAVARGAG
jgi:LacI family transcriptional regulator